MGNLKLISFDLKAEMGFFKKPDINDGIYLTYNMLHKPALLGILGAVLGLRGFEANSKMPEYYEKLKHLKVGIQPLNSSNGNFEKDIVSYNNGTGFASMEEGGNLIVTEQILLKPEYRCFIMLDIDNELEYKLFDYIIKNKAEYLPYLGKNDFSAWWTDTKVYDKCEEFDFSKNFKVVSIFSKTEAVSQHVAKTMTGMMARKTVMPFMYFEKLPIVYDEALFQYCYADFVYSNVTFEKGMDMSETGKFYMINDMDVIQLF